MPELPERAWLSSLFTQAEFTPQDRTQLLAGRPLDGAPDCGKIICACFGVGENSIREAIKTQGLATVEAIGQCLNAGTNCGSCIPELKKILGS